MNVILLTIGSHGDVHPFIGLGVSLKRRGHDVTLVTNEHFAPLARTAGLEFVALGSDEKYCELMRNPQLWHETRAYKFVFREAASPLVEPSYQIIQQHYVPGRTVVVMSSLAYGARVAQDRLGVPTATVHLQPGVMRTDYDVPKLPRLVMPRWLPKWIKRTIWRLGDHFLIDPLLAPAINELRAKVGLPPVRRVFHNWCHSPQLVIGMWPEWFGPRQPDWPPQTRLVGFPLYDESALMPLSPDLEQWLGAGDPPIAFTAGSAMVHAREFFHASAAACAMLHCRGVLLTRFAEQIPGDLPATVRHVDYAPFGTLLPRCGAIVHHGGIGTTAQALRAGIPQLIMPLSHDQFDNAARVERLGVGRSISRRRYRADVVAPLLNSLLDVPRTLGVAARFDGVDALEDAAGLVENLVMPQVQQTSHVTLA